LRFLIYLLRTIHVIIDNISMTLYYWIYTLISVYSDDMNILLYASSSDGSNGSNPENPSENPSENDAEGDPEEDPEEEPEEDPEEDPEEEPEEDQDSKEDSPEGGSDENSSMVTSGYGRDYDSEGSLNTDPLTVLDRHKELIERAEAGDEEAMREIKDEYSAYFDEDSENTQQEALNQVKQYIEEELASETQDGRATGNEAVFMQREEEERDQPYPNIDRWVENTEVRRSIEEPDEELDEEEVRIPKRTREESSEEEQSQEEMNPKRRKIHGSDDDDNGSNSGGPSMGSGGAGPSGAGPSGDPGGGGNNNFKEIMISLLLILSSIGEFLSELLNKLYF
jgi:hypothetical protein